MAAYDIAVLGKKLADRGINATEDTLKGVVDDVFGWVESSIKESATPYDDIALGVLPVIKAETLRLVDKIDGEVG